MYQYKAKIIRVVDGDTVDVDIDLGFGVCLNNERVRITGIDAPESRTSDPVEKLFGNAAKARVEELLPVSSKHILISHDFKGKFGRILGDFTVERWEGIDETLSAILIEEGHAVEYDNGNKEERQAQHLANRDKLLQEGAVSKQAYDQAVALLEEK